MCENSVNDMKESELLNYTNECDNDSGFLSDFTTDLEHIRQLDNFDIINDENADIINGSKASNDIENDQERDIPFTDCAASLIEFLSDRSNFPKDFDELTAQQQHEWLVQKIRTVCKDVPDFVVDLIPPFFRNGDCGRSSSEKPEWLDMDKFRRGQKFARDHLFGVFFAELCSLFMIFSCGSSLKGVVFTNKSHTPYLAFKRYLSTGLRIRNWYTEDPWSEGTSAYEDIKIVRKMHTSFSRRVHDLENRELDEACKIPNVCCPLRDFLLADLKLSCEDARMQQCPYYVMECIENRPKPFSQMDMFTTQFGFVGLVVLFPHDFGIHYATREDLEAFCHLWRGLGYLLGIEDQYNFCRGTLEDVMQRAREFIDYCIKPNFRTITPEWEHMMRCIFEGLQYYFPGMTFTMAFLYLNELLDIQLSYTYATLSYPVWIKYNFSKSLLRYTSRLPGVLPFLNMRLNNALTRAKDFSLEKHCELQNRSAATILRLSGSFAT